MARAKIDADVATGRLKHGEEPPAAGEGEAVAEGEGVKERMERKLREAKGRATYARRKEVEADWCHAQPAQTVAARRRPGAGLKRAGEHSGAQRDVKTA